MDFKLLNTALGYLHTRNRFIFLEFNPMSRQWKLLENFFCFWSNDSNCAGRTTRPVLLTSYKKVGGTVSMCEGREKAAT